VKTLAYSSLAAFLAHYRSLRDGSSSDPQERDLLVRMEDIVGGLHPADRAALLDNSNDSATMRRRQRAERSLRLLLAGQGILQG
jgi:hypothetical protein